MGKYPTHKGTVTVKKGDKWETIGEVVCWIQADDETIEKVKSVSGVVTVEDVKTNFRAWRR